MSKSDKICVFIVDDEEKFLSSITDLEIPGATIVTFNNPQEAIQQYSKYKPRILVTDVMMPGMSGMAFKVVADQFMKLDSMIIISANPRNMVEELGSLEGKLFFKKPLSKDFIQTLESLVAKSAERAAISQDSATVDLNLKSDQVERLFQRWQKLDDYLFEAVKGAHWTMYFQDYFPSGFQKLEQEFLISKEALALNETEFNKVMKLFELKHPSANARIQEHINHLEKIRYEGPFSFPFAFDSVDAFDTIDHKLFVVKDFALINNSGSLEFRVNGLKYQTPFQEYPWLKYFKENTRDSLIAKTLLWRMKEYYQALLMQIPSAVFDDTIRTSISREKSRIHREVNFTPPIVTSAGDAIASFSVLKNNPFLGEATLKDGSKKKTADIYFRTYVGKMEIHAQEKLTIEFLTESTLKIYFRGKEVRVPIEQWVAHNKEFGLTHLDNTYDRIAKTVEYAWDIAHGITEWKIGKKVISLNDILA